MEAVLVLPQEKGRGTESSITVWRLEQCQEDEDCFLTLFFQCLILCKLDAMVMGNVPVNSPKQRDEDGHC